MRARARSEAGVTLIELLIAITLVAALSVGMLMAIRSSLITMDRINGRLESNRRVLGLQQIVSRQIGGAIPLRGPCALQGSSQSLRLVTTYSVNEGARGFPHVVIFTVLPDPQGGSQLVENEYPYAGGDCAGAVGMPTLPLILAGQLEGARFMYHQPQRPNSSAVGRWMDAWNEQVLPSAIQVETFPLKAFTSNLPSLSVNVALHITRLPGAQYMDVDEN